MTSIFIIINTFIAMPLGVYLQGQSFLDENWILNLLHPKWKWKITSEKQSIISACFYSLSFDKLHLKVSLHQRNICRRK
jgi:hypothetical protein